MFRRAFGAWRVPFLCSCKKTPVGWCQARQRARPNNYRQFRFNEFVSPRLRRMARYFYSLVNTCRASLGAIRKVPKRKAAPAERPRCARLPSVLAARGLAQQLAGLGCAFGLPRHGLDTFRYSARKSLTLAMLGFRFPAPCPLAPVRFGNRQGGLEERPDRFLKTFHQAVLL